MLKKHSWFYRLVTTYLPIVYLLVFVLFFVFFMTMNKQSQTQTVSANEAFTRYTMLQLNSILGNIDQNVNAATVNNKEFNQYMFQLHDSDVNPYLLRSKVAELFRQVQAGFPFIQSIYFYRNIDMTVLGTEMYLPLAEFGDRDFVKEQIKQPLPSIWTNVRTYKVLPSQPYDAQVVSLVKKVPFLTEPSGILIVNIDVSSLASWLQSISVSSISSITLVDQAGQLIGQSKVKANKDILNLKFEETGWTFNSGIKESYHYGFFSELYYSWILIGVVMVLIASALIIYLSKRYARPIDASMSRISDYLNLRQPGGELISVVDAAVDKIIDFADRYQSESNLNLPYRQKYFFQELLTGDRPISQDELTDEMHNFGFACNWHSFNTAKLEIDRISDFTESYSTRDQVLLKFVLSNVLKETAEQYGIGIWSEWISVDKMSILFGADVELSMSDISTICESMREWVEANLAFTVTIGVGKMTERSEDIGESYEQAVKAVQYRSALGNNRVIHYEVIARQTETELFDILQLIRTIVQVYKSGNDEWYNQFDFLFKAINRELYTRDELKNLLYYMTFTFTRELSEFPSEYTESWRVEGLIPITQAIDRFETMDDIKKVLLERLSTVAELWKQLRETKNHRLLIHDVKAYIDAHYANADLSLQLLAEQFSLSKNYVSRLFKEETGENFIDYLTALRIFHSKQLLEETGTSIQDIAGLVGYEHYFSFNRAFKKLTGFPPSDFRKKRITDKIL
ncbi:helix-turn-helix domain-containing protein [Paenibacillus sp. MAH-36]|uniref:Helix-turn-helix domain-containing protein n=1 Tax=Paenibacillus violae TaxID=3077234 RepID=A0ABU3RGC0_9BACL|nr:helix-turn-helix domain-containing protein [Paenibacillus sp. PFR10]MDU0203335.1 helix-turn-helix domain-containing protein [Paenibacillus sp. PFR10]